MEPHPNWILSSLLELPPRCVSATLRIRAGKLPTLTTTSYVAARSLEVVNQRFEIVEVKTDRRPPFDLDAMVAEANRRLAEFIEIRFQHHSFWRAPSAGSINIESRVDLAAVQRAISEARRHAYP